MQAIGMETLAGESVSTSSPSSPVVALAGDFGWAIVDEPGRPSIAFKGHLVNFGSPRDAARHVRDLIASKPPSELDSVLAGLDGHFALVLWDSESAIVAVDRVRSIPLLLTEIAGRWLITDHAKPIQDRQALDPADIDPQAALEFAMAGYVLGGKTLYRNVRALIAGERAIVSNDGTIDCRRYALYRPWLAQSAATADAAWRRRLNEVTLAILEKVVAGAAGRQILLPLSAGLDSRLIASGLRHLGYGNVVCFSYGLAGNHEAEAARDIAGRLGFDWHFIPIDTATFRAARATGDYRQYLSATDSLVSTPIEQDVYPVMQLRGLGWAARDAIIINGQSGDYISGGHIPKTLSGSMAGIDRPTREAIILEAAIDKHFGLWPSLQTDAAAASIAHEFSAELQQVEAPVDEPEQAYALYEFLEFQNRQSKYVLGNQRSYEMFGYDWRLPLWDVEYLSFWESVPLKLKVDQRLYRDMLVESNWGGVWTSLLPAPRWVTPSWIRPVRLAARAACAPFGQAAWHRFERRFINHVTDPLRKYAVVPWWTVALCPRDHRSAISWLTADYLDRHGLDWAGRKR